MRAAHGGQLAAGSCRVREGGQRLWTDGACTHGAPCRAARTPSFARVPACSCTSRCAAPCLHPKHTLPNTTARESPNKATQQRDGMNAPAARRRLRAARPLWRMRARALAIPAPAPQQSDAAACILMMLCGARAPPAAPAAFSCSRTWRDPASAATGPGREPNRPRPPAHGGARPWAGTRAARRNATGLPAIRWFSANLAALDDGPQGIPAAVHTRQTESQRRIRAVNRLRHHVRALHDRMRISLNYW